MQKMIAKSSESINTAEVKTAVADEKKPPTAEETVKGDTAYKASSDTPYDTNIIPQNAGKVNDLAEKSDKEANIFYCNVDSVGYKDKKTAKQQVGAIADRMKNANRIMKMTVERLSKAVCMGYSFTTACLSGTTEEYFATQYLAVLDIDNAADIIRVKKLIEREPDTLKEAHDVLKAYGMEVTPLTTVEEAKSVLAAHGIDYSFMYYSFSHSTAHPKFRIVCLLNEPITDPLEAKRLNQYLISLFPQADKVCHNLDRLYYGTDKGLATELHDRRTVINIPDDFTSIQKQPPLIGDRKEELPTEPPAEKTNPKSANSSDLGKAISEFDLSGYVERTTGTIGERKGKDVMFNPCPVCGHFNDFYVDTQRNLYKCHSDKNGTGGNIINYLMETRKLSLEDARNYFLADLLGRDVAADKQAFKAAKQQERIEAQTQRHTSLEEKLKQMAVHEKYSLNDRAYGDLFGELYRNNCRYNANAGQWYYYNGKLWLEDTDGLNVARKAKELFDALLIHAVSLEDGNQKMNFLEYVAKYGKMSRREVLIKDSRDYCPIYQSDLDKNTDLLNCQNGTFDLKTFTLKPHTQDDLLSKITNIVYDPTAKSPLFEKFIYDVMQGDEEKTEYLQKILGYALTADTHLETCFMLYGATTRNGKGTLMETIAHMLGGTSGYAMTIKPETLSTKNNKDSRQASGDIARLNGCRFLNCSEPPKRMIFDIALVKNLLGRDTITARHLYEREFEFVPAFKLFINTNFLPLVTDDSLFSSGRINILTFDKHFEPHEQNKKLKDQLKSEENISGIFNWCLEGLKKFRRDGAEPPKAVADSTAEYRANSDKIGNFIAECLEKTGKNSKAGTVYNAYKAWCDSNGFGCENKGNFFDELRGKNMFSKKATVNGVSECNVVIGYEVIEEEPPTPEEPPKYRITSIMI